MRFPDSFNYNPGTWQQITQFKQANPQGTALPAGVTVEIHIYNNNVVLRSFWNDIWTTPAPPKNTWVDFSLDILFSQDPAKGQMQLGVNSVMSPIEKVRTCAYEGAPMSGVTKPLDATIPDVLMIGPYRDHSIAGDTYADVANVQVFAA
jgi:hypothetical protein